MKVRAIVLAAGKGTRMKSSTPKVLHELCGRPMLWYTLAALREAGIGDIVVVANEELEPHVAAFGVPTVLQREQLGTGHAVRVALEGIAPLAGGRIVIAYADMPLVPHDVYHALLAALDEERGTAMALVTASMPLPSNFGRVVREGAHVRRIVEARDANTAELAISEMNAGIYAFDEDAVRDAVGALRNENAQGEYYLTDVVEHFVKGGRPVRSMHAPDHEQVLGVNDRVELAQARRAMNERLCERHMREGVTILDPQTTYLEPELAIGRDTVVYPNTSIGRLSEIGEGCVVGPNARLSNVRLGRGVTVRESVVADSGIGDGSTVGPFAHIRDGAELGAGVRIGNFVEVKKSRLADGAKSSHLSYLGDATIGEGSNIGAGTITCNYDGKNKHATVIGKRVSIGSNTSIVAPRTIGDGAMTGAGSVVTKDVAPGERVAGNPAKPLPKR
ncbi:MAG TPA: bifunctional UDP-N-acetylglucosamine diphosphorylase/glucosamine-1-phosphate N-acetyltransferase GlmU [Candidatus Dormibacteraeota bacterium]|nr:bifunctional UDP-N-acetylglucosamine diphosphorylase/glucosamine-1-phosphate N-acetyltransferase GlmU [Candidatus Dormibacteraeota bacterium]